jgi:MtfA peptidase
MQVWPRQVVRAQAIVAAGAGVAVAAMAVAISTVVWAATIGPALGAWWWHHSTRRYRVRRALVAAPFPAQRREVLQEKVGFYRRLGAAGRARFETDVTIFLAEQHIVGPQESEVPEETRVLIAAAAAMLGHGRPTWEWPTHRDIIVHITNFNEDYEPGDHHGIAGMVHHQGPVLLSRKQLRRGFKKASDGENVALHELAHVIDMADGVADGAPSIWATMPGWDALVQARIKQIRRGHSGPKGRGGKDPPLRAYAGTNEAELFAVAVEAFFETPDRLRKRDPDLYRRLEVFFNLDPTTGEQLGPDHSARK